MVRKDHNFDGWMKMNFCRRRWFGEVHHKEFIEKAMDGWMKPSMIGSAVPLLLWMIFFSLITRIERRDGSFETIFNMCVIPTPRICSHERTTRSSGESFCRLSQRRGQKEEFSFLVGFVISFLFGFTAQFRHPLSFFLFPSSFSCNCAIFYDCPFFLSIS